MTNNDEMIPGVGIGGLKDKYEIKILICYLLYSIKVPFSKGQLNFVFQNGGFVNYFSFCEALSELIDSSHIAPTKTDFDEIYSLNPLGIETAVRLYTSLPKSLCDNVVKTTMQLLSQIKSEKENESSIIAYKNGYLVKCIIHDFDFDLMSFEVFAPDMIQAEKIVQSFRSDPSKIYRGLISLVVNEEMG